MKLLLFVFVAFPTAIFAQDVSAPKDAEAGLKIIRVDLQRTISKAPQTRAVTATDPASQSQAKADRLRDVDNNPALHRMSKDAEIAPVSGANPHGYIPGGDGNSIVFVASIVVKNIGTKTVALVWWDYQMFETGAKDPIKQFHVHSKRTIAPGEQVELTKEVQPKGKEHQARITRIEYADGSIWTPK